MEPWFRAITAEDFPLIHAIEQVAFPNPWPLDAFSDFLLPWAWGLIFESELVGYIFYHGVGDEMVIINFAISPDFQGRGWGEFLLKESMQKMIESGVRRFFLDVRISNDKARRLYEKFGFVPMGTRKGYYTLPEEDALVMGMQIQ
ncbi:MAG: ribosomal protein S18-alanine N-acetyltransferase [Candidatus Cloacimonetes bacterium]|nr:ribosomal protein S18-alanine N-acetyltransferase [Candidatus Cloacimonadota bacterium]